MYKISNSYIGKRINKILIENEEHRNVLEVSPNLGGAVNSLVINNKVIIKKLDICGPNNDFYSSILFPFANRIDRGVFSFSKKQYQLEINEVDRNHAIHGFVYNKVFSVEDISSSKNSARIILSFTEKTSSKNLPFDYKIKLTYNINKSKLSLKVNIENIGAQHFPFSLGWHPYFYCKRKDSGNILLNSNKKIVFEKNMIPVRFDNLKTTQISTDTFLDECFYLNDKNVIFKNNDYQIKLNSSEKTNYLQVYTPPEKNSVAIEMMTSPPNCFNNEIDLKTLAPNESFKIEWSICYQQLAKD